MRKTALGAASPAAATLTASTTVASATPTRPEGRVHRGFARQVAVDGQVAQASLAGAAADPAAARPGD